MCNDIKISNKILDYTAAGIFLVDKDFRVIYWNKVLEDWTNLDRKEVLGKKIYDLFPHLNAKRFRVRLEMVMQGGPPVIFSTQLHPHFIHCMLKDGSMMIQQTIVNYVYSKEEEAHYLHFTITDMTVMTCQMQTISKLKRKATFEAKRNDSLAQELIIREKLFKSQYKSMPIPTYTWKKVEEDLILHDFNDSAQRSELDIIPCKKGVSAKITLTRFFDILVDTIDCYKNEYDFQNDYSIYVKDKKHYLNIMYTFIKPDYIMMHIDDKTAEKELDESKHEAAALKSAMAVAVTASHEINQPLMVIQGSLDLLRMSCESKSITDKQNVYFERIESSTSRIQVLLNKLKAVKSVSFKEYIDDCWI